MTLLYSEKYLDPQIPYSSSFPESIIISNMCANTESFCQSSLCCGIKIKTVWDLVRTKRIIDAD